MTVIGIPGKPARIKAVLEGEGGKIPIAGFNIMNTVGAIPTCSVVIPIEFIGKIKSQNDKEEDIKYSLKVGYSGGDSDFTMFTGYFSGDGHEITGSSCGAQASLIHPASKIDSGQIVAQALHSSSSIDFSYIIRTKGFTAGASNNVHLIDFYTGGNLINDIKAGIVQAMQDTDGETTDAEGNTGSTYDATAALEAVSSIIANFGGQLDSGITGSITSTINEWVRQIVGNSLTGRASMWDLLSSIFSTFGILLVCDCSTGLVHAIPDVTGMNPPEGNTITGKKEVTAARASSSIIRNIGQVTLFSAAMQNEATAEAGPQVAFASYPEKKKGGSELALAVPGWLNPLAQPLALEEMKVIQQKLAQAYYFIEKNKLKTAAISTPLAPLLMPGTMVRVDPYSAMKPLSDMNVTAIEQKYVGYLHQVSHVFDTSSKQIYSLANIRNYTPEGGADLLPSHPLFADAKCPELL